ncbi:hypothetical protein [Pseudoduganella sp. UC29_71]|uniref:hypothetical protein n=1 Tax=Pseudoduganella sp. UC29_71 TaxID=3350174 RepID=UPI003670D300
MADHFTTRFIDDAAAFAALHERLKKFGYVTEADEPHLNRPVHNSLTADRYQRVFEKHHPAQYTSLQVAACAIDVGDGFPSFYVIYDCARFEDSRAIEHELKRVGNFT